MSWEILYTSVTDFGDKTVFGELLSLLSLLHLAISMGCHPQLLGVIESLLFSQFIPHDAARIRRNFKEKLATVLFPLKSKLPRLQRADRTVDQ